MSSAKWRPFCLGLNVFTVCPNTPQRDIKGPRCEGNHRWPLDSPHKGTVMRKMLPFDDVIMKAYSALCIYTFLDWQFLPKGVIPFYIASFVVKWVQYIPRNMHTVFALLCFVVVIHWLIFPYPSGLLHWHCGNLTIAPVPAKQPWWIWIYTSCEFIMNDWITTTKQSTTKPCAYFLGYTVFWCRKSLAAPFPTLNKHNLNIMVRITYLV